MTDTEALPSIYIVFYAVPVFTFIWLIYRFFARAYMKADYYPEHRKDAP